MSISPKGGLGTLGRQPAGQLSESAEVLQAPLQGEPHVQTDPELSKSGHRPLWQARAPNTPLPPDRRGLNKPLPPDRQGPSTRQPRDRQEPST